MVLNITKRFYFRIKDSYFRHSLLKKIYFCAMFMKMRFFGIGLLLTAFILNGCGDYNKILKSTDYEFKYKKAVEYYEAGEFVKAGTLFQELIQIYRGTSTADKVFYYYAKSMIGQKDYLMAGHYFSTLIKDYSTSDYVEESQFMVGYCNYLLSPKPRLDQQVTQDAIDALQLYINLFPYSQRVEEANRLIDELRDKLVYKSFLSAKLYFDFQNYKAAVIALGNALKEHPDSKYREELMYMLLKSKYLLAVNSIEEKKEQRLSAALDEYFAFKDEFPQSKYLKEVEKYHETVEKMLNLKTTSLNVN
jgi:outer membrane protein assembly factor BamD